GDVNGDGLPDLVTGNYTPEKDPWKASTQYAIGDVVHPTADSKFFFRCTTAGTSGSSEPTWDSTAENNATADGSVVWTFSVRESNRLYLSFPATVDPWKASTAYTLGDVVHPTADGNS